MTGLSIAVVCFPGFGGSGVIACELARALAGRGHRVVVVASAMPERLRVNGVKFEQVDVPKTPVLETAPYGLALANHLVQLVRREKIDLIHLHYAIPHASSALLASQVLGAATPKLVVTLHGTDVTQLGSHPSFQPITSVALAACAGLTVPSQFLRRAAADCFGLAADRIEVISNFVDVERFAPPATRDPAELGALFGRGNGPVLFHVSNFRAIKRPLDLVEVLLHLHRSGPARMVLVGDGPERAAVEAHAEARGIRESLCFLGRRDDFAKLLGHADGFVLPSESESFGVAALEAMASGVPVFGYRVGGLPEVVTEETGRLVTLGDVAGLAAAIREGLASRDQLGRAGRARAVSQFRSEPIVATYERYFQRIVGASS